MFYYSQSLQVVWVSLLWFCVVFGFFLLALINVLQQQRGRKNRNVAAEYFLTHIQAKSPESSVFLLNCD